MPDRLWFTEDDDANRLLAEDPFALLVGFALDQQVTVQQAFQGPLRLKQRLGTLDPETVARADLEPLFREKPAIHRFPGSMATRVQELAALVTEEYGGDASRIWREARDGADLREAHRRASRLRRDEDQVARQRPRTSASASRSRRISSRAIRRSATSTPRRRSPTTRPRSARTRPSGDGVEDSGR